MAKINKRIEIVASTEVSLSSMGPKSRAAIQAVLSKRYTKVDITIVNNLADLMALSARKPDLVFLGMKFIPNNPALGLADPHKLWLSEYLDAEGIAYTGSNNKAIELELNKELAKQRLVDVGLKTAKFKVIRNGDTLWRDDRSLTYPLFVKPTNRGGGTGVDSGSLVYNFHQLLAKAQSLAARLQADSLVEEFLPGREFSVGIMKQVHSSEYLVMPLELVAPPDVSGARFLSGQIKAADTEHHLAVFDTDLKAKINDLATGAFHALGARDYGRIDVRLDAAGIPHFLEANLLPCLIDMYGNFPKACMLTMGLSHEAMILNIVDLAFAREITADDIIRKTITAEHLAASLVFANPAFDAI